MIAHPGASSTGLFATPGGALVKRVLTPLMKAFVFQSAEHGARPILFAATSTEAEPGGYYGPRDLGEMKGVPAPARVPPAAKDEAVARRLWEVSEQLVGLRYPAAATTAGRAHHERRTALPGWQGCAGDRSDIRSRQARGALFAARGAAVTGVARRAEIGRALANDIAAQGGSFHFVAADVSQEADCRRVLEETIERFGRIDILINNAAIMGSVTGTHETATSDWDAVSR